MTREVLTRAMPGVSVGADTGTSTSSPTIDKTGMIAILIGGAVLFAAWYNSTTEKQEMHDIARGKR